MRASRTLEAGRYVALFAFLAAFPGCYASHARDEDAPPDAASPDAASPDAGLDLDPCGTSCGDPTVVARVDLDARVGSAPAVLSAVVHRDELVAAVLLTTRLGSVVDPERPFALARISTRTGEARLEQVPVLADVQSVAAATLASDGETLTLVALYDEVPPLPVFPPPADAQPVVLVAAWAGDATSPTTRTVPLTDERLPRCARCLRRGASVALTGTRAIAALAGEGVLHVARIELDGAGVLRDTLSIPGVDPNSALDARGDGAGTALLGVGGARDILGAVDSAAMAVSASASRVSAPVALPGSESDSVPFPLVRDGRLEVVRFLRDVGRSEGALHWLVVDGDRVSDLGAIDTAGRLPPIAMASTTSALLWAESSLAPIGEADLRVLVSSPGCTTTGTPSTVVHLPLPIGAGDPRALAATEADGRTYAFVVESEGLIETFRAYLTVIDLGECRAGTPR